MRKITINSEDYKKWENDTFREYASCSVRHSKDLTRRLKFSVSAAGQFQVKLGSKLLYQGTDFDIATQFFHAAQDK